MSDVRIDAACWQDAAERADMTRIRNEVFVGEQGVPLELEIDGADPGCRHVLAREAGGRPVGTARMQATGHIGRIAVLAARRRQGIGARLVEALVREARAQGLACVDLNAQVQAVDFYRKLGFEARGEVFMEAGIPHQEMWLRLADDGPGR